MRTIAKYSATLGHTSVAGDMLVSCLSARGRAREFKVAPRIKIFIRPWQIGCFLSGAFLFTPLAEAVKGVFLFCRR